MDDFTRKGLLNRWTIMNGQAVCLYNAVPTDVLSPQEVDDILQANENVRQRIAAVERLEQAYEISKRKQPPETITRSTAIDAAPIERANPEYEQWIKAFEIIANADEATRNLYESRHLPSFIEEEIEDVLGNKTIKFTPRVSESLVLTPDPIEARVLIAKQIAEYKQSIQKYIEGVANGRGYDSGVSLASYKEDPNAVWAAEAATFILWRSGVWEYVLTEFDKVRNGLRSPPSIDELIGELPEIQWES